jgi:hypothetical protein
MRDLTPELDRIMMAALVVLTLFAIGCFTLVWLWVN